MMFLNGGKNTESLIEILVGTLVLAIFFYGLLCIILYIKKEIQILNNNHNKNIAKRVKEKMEEMRSCPNEIDIILNIINPKEFNCNAVPHCKKTAGMKNVFVTKNIKFDNT